MSVQHLSKKLFTGLVFFLAFSRYDISFSQNIYDYEIIECPDDTEGCCIVSTNNHGNAIITAFSPQNKYYIYNYKTKQTTPTNVPIGNYTVRILDDDSVHGLGKIEKIPGLFVNKPFRLVGQELSWIDIGTEYDNFNVNGDCAVSSTGTIAATGYVNTGYKDDYYIYLTLRNGSTTKYSNDNRYTIIGVTSNNTIILDSGYISLETNNFKQYIVPSAPGEEISYIRAHAASDNGIVILTYISKIDGFANSAYGYYDTSTDNFNKGESNFILTNATFLSMNNQLSFVGQHCPGYGCIAVLAKNDSFYYINQILNTPYNGSFDVAWSISNSGFIGGLTNSRKAFLAWPKKQSFGIHPVYNILLHQINQ